VLVLTLTRISLGIRWDLEKAPTTSWRQVEKMKEQTKDVRTTKRTMKKTKVVTQKKKKKKRRRRMMKKEEVMMTMMLRTKKAERVFVVCNGIQHHFDESDHLLLCAEWEEMPQEQPERCL